MQTASGTPQANTMRLGRVVRSYPDRHVIDVVFLDDGGFASGVGVGGPWASQEHGWSYLPHVDDPPDGHWSVEMTHKEDCLALIGYFSGMPFCVGFFYPAPHAPGSEDLFKFTHISGSYISIDAGGTITLAASKRGPNKPIPSTVTISLTGIVADSRGARAKIGVIPGYIELN